MTQTSVELTFEEYLTYDDGTDNRYELEDGVLIKMTPQSPIHVLIALFLYNTLNTYVCSNYPHWLVTQAGVGVQTQTGRTRYPDISIVEQSVFAMLTTNNILNRQEPLILAIEIVSPESVKRDYIDKLAEYQALNIPEYWIVDPIKKQVTINQLLDGVYQNSILMEKDIIVSALFPGLVLTVKDILRLN